jgi:hypothetical protein
MELLQGEINLVAQGIALLLLQLFELAGRSPQPSVGSVSEGRNDLQIAGQFFEGGSRWYFRLCFTLYLQKQLWLFEETLPDLG